MRSRVDSFAQWAHSRRQNKCHFNCGTHRTKVMLLIFSIFRQMENRPERILPANGCGHCVFGRFESFAFRLDFVTVRYVLKHHFRLISQSLEGEPPWLTAVTSCLCEMNFGENSFASAIMTHSSLAIDGSSMVFASMKVMKCDIDLGLRNSMAISLEVSWFGFHHSETLIQFISKKNCKSKHHSVWKK